MIFDYLGLNTDNKKKYGYDAFGEFCCLDEMLNIVKYVIGTGTPGHLVGHAFISCPTSGTWGKYPKYRGVGVVIGPGEIRDDSGLLKEKGIQRYLNKTEYKACPGSYKKMARLIRDARMSPDIYSLSGAQCNDWVNELLSEMGVAVTRGACQGSMLNPVDAERIDPQLLKNATGKNGVSIFHISLNIPWLN